jgi:hypothetical protein
MLLAGIWWSGCKKDEYKNLDCSTIASAYNANIKSIINATCISSGCHNSGSNNGDFTSYAGVKVKVDNGSLDRRVLTDKNMPPSGALSLDNRKKIKCWIENGAPNN